jgi:hypothetical protein
MVWYDYPVWFLAGALLSNAIPHIAQGMSGNRFQTPFAKPPGMGESSAMTNVLWGFANLLLGAVLITSTWPMPSPPWRLDIAAFLGALLLALYTARHFSRVRNGAPRP